MTFLVLRIINQHSKPRNDILFNIATLINESMCVIEFVLRNLISHKQEKPLSHEYVVGIWMRTEITFMLWFCIPARLVGAPKSQ